MTDRRNLDRERLEVYLLHLLLRYRPYFQICAIIFLISSVAVLIYVPIFGMIMLFLAVFLILLSSSYQLSLWVAKIGAWVGTVRMDDH